MKNKVMQIVEQICNTKSTDCKSLNKAELARELMNLANIPQNADIQEIPLDWDNQVVILFVIPEDKENYFSLFAGIGNDGNFYFVLSITGKDPFTDKFYFLDEEELLPIDYFCTKTEDFERVVSNIYDRTPNEMMILAKIIKAAGKDVVDPIKSAFEKVLDMRYTDRIDVYRFYYEEA